MAEINAKSSKFDADLNAVLDSLYTDVAALAAALDTLAAKLNADAGVTDTDYATGNVAALTTTQDS